MNIPLIGFKTVTGKAGLVDFSPVAECMERNFGVKKKSSKAFKVLLSFFLHFLFSIASLVESMYRDWPSTSFIYKDCN